MSLMLEAGDLLLVEIKPSDLGFFITKGMFNRNIRNQTRISIGKLKAEFSHFINAYTERDLMMQGMNPLYYAMFKNALIEIETYSNKSWAVVYFDNTAATSSFLDVYLCFKSDHLNKEFKVDANSLWNRVSVNQNRIMQRLVAEDGTIIEYVNSVLPYLLVLHTDGKYEEIYNYYFGDENATNEPTD